MSRLVSRSAPGGVCVVNRDDFVKSFRDVPKITITSLADVKANIDGAIGILSKSQEDWTKRMNQLKAVRSIVLYGEDVVGKDQLLGQLVRLTDCLDLSVKDLRSQILREAAVTCSFLVEHYGSEVHQIADRCLPTAFTQVSSSTKVMATSASTLTQFIVQYVQTKQIFTTIISYATSKDKNQRRHLATLLEVVIEHWNEKMKKMVMGQVCELVKAAICDADPETRTNGRRAFNKLDEVHPEDAEKLFQSVDASKQKMLRAADAGSSSNSINSERGSVPLRSKLSGGTVGALRNVPNISSQFLARRSASAIEPKQMTRMTTSVSRTPVAARVPIAAARSAKVDTSPGGSKFTRPTIGTFGPRTTSNLRARGSVPTSQPGSRNTSPPRRSGGPSFSSDIQRVKSNLGTGSFVSSLSTEEARKLQKALDSAKESLGQPSRTDEDEFLLPKRPAAGKPKTPQKSALDVSRVEQVIRACCSTSSNEKKEGIKSLATVVSDPTLSDIEVRNMGSTLNRLLADVTNPSVLEAVSSFVQTHHSRLGDWLKLGLGKLFTKKGAEMMPTMKKPISATIDTVLKSFEPSLQLRSTCELMCDPIHLLNPKARQALLEYLNELLEKRMERGAPFNSKEVRATIMKMFSWMTDSRVGQLITPVGEKVLCSLFALNSADFSALFNDFNPDYRDWAYRVLQTHGHNQPDQQEVADEMRATAAQIEDFVTARHHYDSEKSPASLTGGLAGLSANRRVDLGPLRPLANELNREDEMNLNDSFDRLKLNSTTHLIDDHSEQKKYVSAKLAQITSGSSTEQFEGLQAIQMMLSEGSFTLWEHNFNKLLISVFDVLSKSDADANKKTALRVLTKMCTCQAARLFDSSEMAIWKVLDAAVNSQDGTVTVSADDCLKTLATHLPLAKIVNVSKTILNEEGLEDARASLVLKMVMKLFDNLQSDELDPVVDELAPCAIRAYDSKSSTVRKSAVYCLVAMVNKLGMRRMESHLQLLSKGKLDLIQVYVNRAMSSSAHSHV
ncbi:unnamed protein product [Caenorhabditis sp. 36 PRJEB53466]|nr:unnamed protein product [Caenorhabditis sp. 36 PRJEB53466]